MPARNDTNPPSPAIVNKVFGADEVDKVNVLHNEKIHFGVLTEVELAIEKKFLRRIDSLIMPLVVLAYLMNYIDRWLIRGIHVIFVGIIIVVILPDLPLAWRLLSPEMKDVAIRRFAIEAAEADQDEPGDKSAWTGFKLAFGDPKTYIIAIAYMCGTGAAGFQNFFPTLSALLGYSHVISLLLVAPPYIFIIIWALGHSRLSNCYVKRSWFFNFGAPYFSLFLMVVIFTLNGTLYAWIASIIPRPLAKCAAAFASINSFGNTASIWTPFTYRDRNAPFYRPALGACIAMQTAAGLMAILLRIILERQNKMLDKLEREDVPISQREEDHLRRTSVGDTFGVEEAKGDVNSPASFEKVLSKLAQQIAAASLALDTSRSRARRSKALWTLYTTLTYLLFLLITFLVLGPKNWSVPHYVGVIGAPLLIYSIRRLITLFFDWRIARQQSYLAQLQKQREEKIADLKKATKYDSTQELLQKYGAAPPKQKPASSQPQQGIKRKVTEPREQVQRTGLPPPPTANIPRRNAGQLATPQKSTVAPPSPESARFGSPQVYSQNLVQFSPDTPGFAPDAFNIAPPSAPPAYSQPVQWYDRILDVLLGEDETAAKNRFALICSNCRLVNGQAPPGVKSLEEIGRWRCSSCGTMNGEESEAKKVVQQVVEKAKADENEGWEKVPRGHQEEDEQEVEDVDMKDSGPPTTARDDALDDSGVSKRITRSVQKGGQLESLE
ncbi:hypothetical protein DV736_g4057, partial [Chaetothyriales sp. CBS 134916]